LSKDLEDRTGQAETLRLLAASKLAAGKKNDALAPAQDLMKLFEELGDMAGITAARRTVNVVYAEKNQLDKAPDRPEALQVLKSLAAAVDARDAQAWQTAMQDLDQIGAYTQKDIDETIAGALEKDRSGASVFLEEQGIMVQGSSVPQIQMKEYNKTMQYLHFRLGALGYGPRFRCLLTSCRSRGIRARLARSLACRFLSRRTPGRWTCSFIRASWMACCSRTLRTPSTIEEP